MKINLFKFEIKKQLKGTLIFTSVLCALLALYLFGIYPSFIASKAEILPLFEKFPEAFLNAFGMNMDSFFSYIGILTFSYVYIGLIGGIMAVTIGQSIFSRETRNKCSDFLITKPISRKKIFSMKLLAALTLNMLSGSIFILLSILFYVINGEGSFSIYVLIIIAMASTQFVFLTIGIFLGVFLKRIKSVASLAVGVGIMAFMISALQGITQINLLKLISPLQYFSPSYIAKNNSVELLYVVVAIIVIVTLPTLSYFKYQTKEF